MMFQTHSGRSGFLLLLLVFGIVQGQDTVSENRISKEYCTSERFEIRCPSETLIVIHSAVFGRMRGGRCISEDYSHALGCQADITNYVDSRCTGNQSCSMLVGVFESIAQPCPKDFKSYLKVEYECAKVPRGGCGDGPKQSTLIVNGEGYMALSPDALANAGSCQWEFQAEGGRKLRFILVTDITGSRIQMENDRRVSDRPFYCQTQMTFTEASNSVPVEFCNRPHQDMETLYSSTSASVRLTVEYKPTSQRAHSPGITPILLRYKVFGCRDIVPPEGAMVRHTPEGVAVICNQSLETWWLTCKHDTWIGEFDNCTKTHADSGPTLPSTRKEIQNGIVLAVLVGVVLGVIVGACMLCIIFVVRRSKRRTGRNRASGTDIQYEPRVRHSQENVCDPSYPSLLPADKMTTCEYEHMCNAYPMTFKANTDGSQILKLQLNPQQIADGECKLERTLISPERLKLAGCGHTRPDGTFHTGDPMTYYDLEPPMGKPLPGSMTRHEDAHHGHGMRHDSQHAAS